MSFSVFLGTPSRNSFRTHHIQASRSEAVSQRRETCAEDKLPIGHGRYPNTNTSKSKKTQDVVSFWKQTLVSFERKKKDNISTVPLSNRDEQIQKHHFNLIVHIFRYKADLYGTGPTVYHYVKHPFRFLNIPANVYLHFRCCRFFLLLTFDLGASPTGKVAKCFLFLF